LKIPELEGWLGSFGEISEHSFCTGNVSGAEVVVEKLPQEYLIGTAQSCDKAHRGFRLDFNDFLYRFGDSHDERFLAIVAAICNPSVGKIVEFFFCKFAVEDWRDQLRIFLANHIALSFIRSLFSWTNGKNILHPWEVGPKLEIELRLSSCV
jgi:hypothetical protein